MSTARRGLSWGVCLVALFAVGCAGNKKWAHAPPAGARCNAVRQHLTRSGSAVRSGRRSDCPVGPAFRNRPEGARGRPSRDGKDRVQPLPRSPAGIARRRAVRAANPRALRPAGRADQRLRGDRPGPGRRVRREGIRAGVDRRAPGDFHVRAATAPHARKPSRRSRRTSRPIAHDIDIPLNPRVLSYVQLFTGRLKGYLEEGLEPRCALPADDPGGLPGRRAAARSRLRAADRERVQAKRPLESQGQGHLAVHARHRARERPQARLVHRRALGPGESDARRGQVPQDAVRHVRATGISRSRRTTAAPDACSAR